MQGSIVNCAMQCTELLCSMQCNLTSSLATPSRPTAARTTSTGAMLWQLMAHLRFPLIAQRKSDTLGKRVANLIRISEI